MNTAKQVNLMVGLLMVSAVALLLYFLWDTTRADEATQRQLEVNAERGAKLYAQNCRACHGLTGQGILESSVLPGVPLNLETYRSTEPLDLGPNQRRLTDTIRCGRIGTLMPLWSEEQGGPLNDFQILQLVTLLTGAMPVGDFDVPEDTNVVSEIGWEHAIVEANHTDELGVHLIESVDDTATVWALNDVSRLAPEMLLRIDDEPVDGVYEVVDIIEVRDARNEIEVVRGEFGTSATDHGEGAEVFAGPVIPPTGPLTGESVPVPCGQKPQAGPTPAATPVDGGDGPGPTPSSDQPDVPQAVEAQVTEAVDGVIETEMGDNFYTRNNLKVALGETVTIQATNTGIAIHNLRIAGPDGEWSTDDDLVSDPGLAFPGDTVVVEFTSTEAGTFTFRCDFHPLEQGGVIVVE
jgi:mono/diheme cytochrome c family protein/plastocyanin